MPDVTRRNSFEEGEEVIFYNAHTKLSHAGKIVEVLGNNNYLADIDGLTKHVSGDVISKVGVPGIADTGTRGDIAGINSTQEDILDQDREDIASVCTESSIGSDIGNSQVVGGNVAMPPTLVAHHRRRRRREADSLGQPVANLPRLRPLEARVNKQLPVGT